MDFSKIRKKAGLSQAELARKVGVTRQAINRIERGNLRPSIGTAKAIAKALDCKWWEVIDIGYYEKAKH